MLHIHIKMCAMTNIISIFPRTIAPLFSSHNLSMILDWPYRIHRNDFQLCCQQHNKKSSLKKKHGREQSSSKKSDWVNEQLYGPLLNLDVTEKTGQQSPKKNVNVKLDSKAHETKIDIKNNLERKINQKDEVNLMTKQSISKFTTKTDDNVKPEILCKKTETLKTLPGYKEIDFPLIVDTSEKILKGVDLKEYLKALAENILSSDNNYIPSITSILQKTMSAENAAILERWRLKMIESLGVEGFAKYQQETFQRGQLLHEAINKHLSGEESKLLIDPQIDGYWKSISSVLQDIKDVSCLEEKMSHPYLHYCGITDCVAKYRDQRMLIEWKTSQKPKPTLKHTYDYTLQVVAYIGAYNSLQKHESEAIDNGLIVVAYEDGTPAHAHKMSRTVCEDTWKLWLLRLKEFWQFKTYSEIKQK